MNRVALFLSLLLPLSSSCFAETVPQENEITQDVPVEIGEVAQSSLNPLTHTDEVPQNLKIVGKGLITKDESQSLAIACVGATEPGTNEASCNQLRIVEFNEAHIPHWEGNAFEIKNPDEFSKTLKKAYKKKYRIHFLRVKKDVAHNKAAAKVVGDFASVGVIGLTIAANSAPAGVVIASSVIGGVSIILAPFALLIILQAARVDVVGGTINLVLAPFRGLGNAVNFSYTSSMTATNGWNWTTEPTRVSQKKYNKVKALLADFSNGTLTQK